MWFDLSGNTMAGHIAEQRAGFYKKAHRHAAGAHITVLGGKGYSLVWGRWKRAHADRLEARDYAFALLICGGRPF